MRHSVGASLEGDALKAALTGKTLSVGQLAAGGPIVWQLRADGTLSVLAGAERRERWSGHWKIDDRGRYCRTLNEPRAAERCFTVLANEARLLFFDGDGLMQFDTTAE